ncbi:MAG: hypothetical protein ACFBSF_10100 [Leptolyngbyaceae cyanobacterium]
MSLETAVEKVLPEIVQRMDDLKAAQDREIGELRRSLDTWGAVTHQLTELLSARTKETEGVASSYATLAEYLMKFAVHLSASEGIMRAVETQLKHSSTMDDSSALTSTATLKLLAETQDNQAQLKALLHQMMVPLQKLAQGNPPQKDLSIWTEVFAWRPAIAWFAIGGMGVAVFLWLTLRMSGFDLAVRSLLSVDSRLQRIEQFIGLEEVPHEAAEPAFEEEAMPAE